VATGTGQPVEAVLDAMRRADLGRREPVRLAPDGLWGRELRVAIRSLRPADRLAAWADASSLRELLERLGADPVGLSEDELRVLGLVVVVDDGGVAAVHLLRPVERDAGGHLQRRPPAVLAARAAGDARWDHFAWGIEPELADRVDRSERDLARTLAGRTRLLHELSLRHHRHPDDVARAVRDHLAAEPPREPAPDRPRARDPWPPAGSDGHTH
jgi:hypothetical protein